MRSAEGLRIVYVDDFSDGDGAARVYRDLGLMEINLSRWRQLPEQYRDYILAHEEGHYVLDTSDETAADEYAFRKLAGTRPGSLRQTALALINVLPGVTEEQQRRMDAAILRSLKYDAIHNGNSNARKEYIRITGRKPEAQSNAYDSTEKQTAMTAYRHMAIPVAIMIALFIISRKKS
jgi:hypothetical protein